MAGIGAARRRAGVGGLCLVFQALALRPAGRGRRPGFQHAVAASADAADRGAQHVVSAFTVGVFGRQRAAGRAAVSGAVRKLPWRGGRWPWAARGQLAHLAQRVGRAAFRQPPGRRIALARGSRRQDAGRVRHAWL
ncbi:hypothetical protein G6F63_013681 [Rhizopus arrhizus]|nr:hypothetical protein G6F63_013681 [Rhizopus arrhizus]